MIKAVFFDWFNTLSCYNPPREELYLRVFREYGIELTLKTIYKALQVGDRYFFSASARRTVRGSGPDELINQFMRYPESICQESGLTVPSETQREIMQKVLSRFTNTFTLFEDSIPVLQKLKAQKIVTGVITNADQTVYDTIKQLGILPHLDIIITSEQVGAEKPAAPIFLAAIRKSGHHAEETIFIGDQYASDVLGAHAAGMKSILIDRYDTSTAEQKCLKIRGLTEVFNYL